MFLCIQYSALRMYTYRLLMLLLFKILKPAVAVVGEGGTVGDMCVLRECVLVCVRARLFTCMDSCIHAVMGPCIQRSSLLRHELCYHMFCHHVSATMFSGCIHVMHACPSIRPSIHPSFYPVTQPSLTIVCIYVLSCPRPCPSGHGCVVHQPPPGHLEPRRIIWYVCAWLVSACAVRTSNT